MTTQTIYWLLCLFILEGYSLVLNSSAPVAIGLENFATSVVKDNYGYFGTYTEPGYVVKVDLTNMTRVDYISFNTGESYLSSSVVYRDCAFFGGSSGVVIKVNLTSFKRVRSLSLSTYTLNTVQLYNNIAYFGGYTSILRVNLDTFSYLGGIPTTNNLQTSLSYSNYGYYIGDAGIIHKVDFSTNKIVANLTIGTTCNFAFLYGNDGYFGSVYSNLLRINLDNLTIIDQIGITGKTASVIGNYAFIAGVYSNVLDLSNFNVISSNPPSLTTLSSYAQTSFISNNTIYYGMGTSPAQIYKFNLSNSIIGNLFVDTPSYFGGFILYKNYVYYTAGKEGLPNSLVKIDLDNMTKMESLAFYDNEGNFPGAFIYNNNGYFTDFTSGNVIEINLDEMNRTGNTYYIANSISGSAASGDNVYLATNPIIYRFELSSLSITGSVSAGGQPNQIAVLPDNNLYVSTYTQVLQFDSNTLNVLNTSPAFGSFFVSFNYYDNYGYFVTQSSIYQVNLTTLECINNLTQSTDIFYSSIVSNNSIYVGTGFGYVIQYLLPSFTMVRNVSLSERYVSSLFFYKGFLYAGTSTGKSTLFKIDVTGDDLTTTTTTGGPLTTTIAESISTSTSSSSSSSTSSSSTSSTASTLSDSTTSTSSTSTSTTGDPLKSSSKGGSSSSIYIGVVVALVVVILAGVAIGLFLYKRKKNSSDPEKSVELDLLPLLSDITILGELGKGNFGQVFKGSWKGSTVALKALKDNGEFNAFIKECNVLSQLSHPNIVQFMGVYKNEQKQIFLVTEFMSHGDLLSLVRTTPQIETAAMTDMALQALSGMAYLHSKNIIHRDLALRNLLVTMNQDRYIIKVADFGMSSVLDDHPIYYQQKPGTAVPVKWTAPEVLKFGKVSMASDVWSFGICLWELYSKGETPYAAISDPQTMLDHLDSGYRLPCPKKCPAEIYEIMLACWKEEYGERPSFDDILRKWPSPSKEEDKQSTFSVLVEGGNEIIYS